MHTGGVNNVGAIGGLGLIDESCTVFLRLVDDRVIETHMLRAMGKTMAELLQRQDEESSRISENMLQCRVWRAISILDPNERVDKTNQ